VSDHLSRSNAARIAALSRVAQVGGHAISAPARAARLEAFAHAVDPDGVLTPVDREQRAHALLRAEMTRLAAKSVAARRKARDNASARYTVEQLRSLADALETESDGAA
jgi:hypothetical protein